MADCKNISDQSDDGNLGEMTRKISDLKLKEIADDLASSYILVDIGANLTNSKYARDLDSVIDRAKDAGMFIVQSAILHRQSMLSNISR